MAKNCKQYRFASYKNVIVLWKFSSLSYCSTCWYSISVSFPHFFYLMTLINLHARLYIEISLKTYLYFRMWLLATGFKSLPISGATHEYSEAVRVSDSAATVDWK